MAGATDKRQLLTLLCGSVSADLATMSAAQRAVVEGATHPENKPENDKDTRALEQSYLARGQAQRVAQLQGELNQLKALQLRAFSESTPIALGALVLVDDGRDVAPSGVPPLRVFRSGSMRLAHYFIAPAGGGRRIRLADIDVRVVTPEAPIARSLLGKHEGDTLELRTPLGSSEWRISRVI
jgi:Transcription elongation factor, GreA/GreB, C-term